MRKLLFLILGTVFCGTVNAQTQLTEYKPGVTTEGAVYFLPKTAVRFTFLVEKTTYTPGDFAAYAQRYMRLKDVSQEPSTQYRILQIKQTPVAVVDSTKKYAIKFDAKTVAANVALADDGRLLAINAEPNVDMEEAPFKAAPKSQRVNPRQLMNQDILSAGHKIQYYETDKMGVTHHSNYIRWMEEARVDFMEKIGWSYTVLEENGIISPVTSIECKYVAGTTFAETISVETSIEELKNVKVRINYVMKNEEGKIVCKGASEHCFLDSNGTFISIAKKFPGFYEALSRSMEKED